MMETKKQKAICGAYGDYWDLFTDITKKRVLNNNGKVDYFLLTTKERDETESVVGDIRDLICVGTHEGTQRFFIPKSILGIENNNGWIAIDNEEDLPKTNKLELFNVCFVDDENYILYDLPMSGNNVGFEWKNNKITHYKPIQTHFPPIY